MLDISEFTHIANDNRPYAQIEVKGRKIVGLLDSGAQSSVAGRDFRSFMESVGVKPSRTESAIRTADGTVHPVNDIYMVPITYLNRTRMVEVLYVSTVPDRLILGMDFWEVFKIKPIVIGSVECDKNIPLSDNHDLTPDQAEALGKILARMPFSQNGALSKTHLITHSIDTGSAPPIKQRHYIVSPYVQKDINVEIDRLLALDVIEACEPGAWSSPIVVVRKASGKVRLCLDARRLNDVTIKDAYPQPQINRILGRLAGTKVLSSIDFSDAFLQVPLDASSQPKTAFAISGRGYYKYKRMAFGLCNSGATLCRLVDKVIGCDLEPFVFVYLDDIIIATNDFDSHFKILSKLAERISAAGLTISVSKSRFCMRSLKYLGYIVNEEGIRPDPEKIAAIEGYPVPKSVKDVRRLIGLTGWYRRFIPNFATITAPITELIKKNCAKIEWNPEAQEALVRIKVALTSAPVLSNPNYESPFIIQTDASDSGMGAVLVQGEGEDERVVAYWSQKLSSAQRKYQTTERECLAVILAVEKFRPYIEGAKFTVITDHASLLWLRNLKDPTGRLGRWALRLQPYDFVLQHRKGKFMVVADALSRAVDSIDVAPNLNAWYDNLKIKIIGNPRQYPLFKIQNGAVFKRCAKSDKGIGQHSKWREVVKPSDRQALLFKNHDSPLSAHGGFFKTADRIKRSFYWPRMDADIREYVAKCETCKACKPSNRIQRSPMGKFREASRPFELIYVDFVGPLPRSKSGNTVLFVVVDGFSKFVHTHPMRAATALASIKCLRDHIFLLFGTPRYLVSDNGAQFTATIFKSFLDEFKVTTWYTARYHPQANATEAANKTVETAMRAFLKDEDNHRSWDLHLSEITCAINTAKHTSTDLSPYFVLFGLHMCTSGSDYQTLQGPELPIIDHVEKGSKIREMVKTSLKKNYERNKRRYDLRSRPITYNVGDVVWVKNRVLSNAIKGIIGKLTPNYKKGTIRRKVGTNSYEVSDLEGNSIGIFNTDSFKTN